MTTVKQKGQAKLQWHAMLSLLTMMNANPNDDNNTTRLLT